MHGPVLEASQDEHLEGPAQQVATVRGHGLAP
jgi:hypothetical protein